MTRGRRRGHHLILGFWKISSIEFGRLFLNTICRNGRCAIAPPRFKPSLPKRDRPARVSVRRISHRSSWKCVSSKGRGEGKMSFRNWLFETLGLGSGAPPRPTPSTHTASASSLVVSQKPAFICPICASACRTEQAPFSQYVTLHRCPQQHFVGVECASCKQGVMNHVGDLDFTVHTKCPNCAHQSSGIPKDWWYRNAAKRQQTLPSKPSSPLQDRRKELGACLDDMKGWGGLTVDFIAARLVSQDAAQLAFHTLSSRARQNAGGRGVVVAYGSLTLNAQALFVAG